MAVSTKNKIIEQNNNWMLAGKAGTRIIFMLEFKDYQDFVEWVCHYTGSQISMLRGIDYLDNQILNLEGSSRCEVWIEKEEDVMAFKLRWS